MKVCLGFASIVLASSAAFAQQAEPAPGAAGTTRGVASAVRFATTAELPAPWRPSADVPNLSATSKNPLRHGHFFLVWMSKTARIRRPFWLGESSGQNRVALETRRPSRHLEMTAPHSGLAHRRLADGSMPTSAMTHLLIRRSARRQSIPRAPKPMRPSCRSQRFSIGRRYRTNKGARELVKRVLRVVPFVRQVLRPMIRLSSR
jgi:hypothetical protein